MREFAEEVFGWQAIEEALDARLAAHRGLTAPKLVT